MCGYRIITVVLLAHNYGRSYVLDFEQLLDFWLVETDDDLAANENDRHAHLTALLYHLLPPLGVNRHIVFGIGDSLLLEEDLRRVAIDTGRS